VQVAWDAADLAELRRLQVFHATVGVGSEILTSRELREAEPALAAGIPGGLLVSGDHQVDNRRLHAALMTAAVDGGVRLIRDRIATITVARDRVVEVRTRAGERLASAVVVLAAGAWSRLIGGLPDPAVPPVRPVKGQTLRLRGPHGVLTHVVRGLVKASPVYLVPRTGGELVVGASSEEVGFDVRPRAGAVYDLLRDACSLVPELDQFEFTEVSTGLRPGTPDNAPLLGETTVGGLVLATGHYRNGILLAPVTGDGIAQLIVDGHPPSSIAPFGPQRFRSAVPVAVGQTPLAPQWTESR
jgi:glycine oxidase